MPGAAATSTHSRRSLRHSTSGAKIAYSSSSLTVAQQGFDAWRRGDFDALEAIFAPDVEWRWFEPGDWDCHNRDDVMRLRERHAAGFAEGRLNFPTRDPTWSSRRTRARSAVTNGRMKRQPSCDS